MFFKYLKYKGRKLLISVVIGAGSGAVIGLIFSRLPLIVSMITLGVIILGLIGLVMFTLGQLIYLDYQNYKDKN